jgi:hypothetical protein
VQPVQGGNGCRVKEPTGLGLTFCTDQDGADEDGA